MVPFSKAHAYGNDFLYVNAARLTGVDYAAVARRLCDRHRGIGADGLIVYTPTAGGAVMALLNADGSRAELSGNGLRGLAALLARDRHDRPGAVLLVETAAGPRRLELLGMRGNEYEFEADMGRPTDLRQEVLDAAGERVPVSVLNVGNPQCVCLGPLPDAERFARLGPALERHPSFPQGTNVEFASVDAPDRVRILIWERGVGPTESSGTGSCAAAVAAAAHGGASKSIEVVAPGGAQRVVWDDAGLRLTGWAEIIADGTWPGLSGSGLISDSAPRGPSGPGKM
jgi:diaminopimelate epimerase